MTLKYKIKNHGCEHSQYFQGVGTGDFENVVLGRGYSPLSAGEEAFESFHEQVSHLADVQEVEALEKEVSKLSDKDCHEKCGVDFCNEWKSKREWTVSVQRPWDGEPEPVYIEISQGTEHFSPGALVKGIQTFSDPEEAVKYARIMASRWEGSGIYFGSAEFGVDDVEGETEEDLNKWAEEMEMRIDEEKQAAFDKAHENCELTCYVSIRWTLEKDCE